MKKISCTIAVVLLFTAILSAQDDVSQSRWAMKKIVPDGNNAEWKKPLNLYDAITGLLFTVANDSSRLYLCFINNDERKITKLMKAGWSIELLSKEKNKKFAASVVFPAVQMITAPGKDEGVTKSDEANFRNELALYRLNVHSVNTSGFVSANGDIPMNSEQGITAGIGSDSTQKIIFELAIPLKELIAENNTSLNEEMTLHITIHKLKKPPYKGDPEGRDLVGKQRGRNGTSPGASENSIFPVDRSLLYTEIDFKQKFRLAEKAPTH